MHGGIDIQSDLSCYLSVFEQRIKLYNIFLISVGTMVNFVALAREHWVNILVPMGFVIGWYLDKHQDQKLTAFRNKSVLFSR